MSKPIISSDKFKDFPWADLEPYGSKVVKCNGKFVINVNGTLWEVPDNLHKLLESYFERGERHRSEKIRSLLSN